MEDKITYFTDVDKIEEKLINQLSNLIVDENILEIAVFPDIHYASEKSMPVGVSFKTKDFIYPLVSGKDTGCGVALVRGLNHIHIRIRC